MAHNHSHNYNINLGNAFKTGITINIIFIVVEALFGFLSNSMALIADAGHNLSDVLALGFSWIAVILSQRKPTLKFTYGFRRSTILIALLNTILLLAAVGFIVYETIERLKKPAEINANSVMIVAALGIGVNAFTAWLFMRGKKHDLNIRSAFLHFVSDALVSLGVVVAGIIMAFTGIQWIDSLVSFAIIVVILYSSYHLLIDSVNLALDAVPENVNIEEVRGFLEELPEVSGVHDLHIWALGTTDAALTVHLTTCEQTDVGFIISIQNQLHERFGIEHATIQVEFGSKEDCGIKN
ncbi:MAG: cation diffusion facilitator family transporter [Bacteroidales bacterium]|jgi:cobalt-zinc-cadmium efflux system protein|nr:cation diffusion facilitator family transporter [Bacteroidales bacterium]